MDDTSMRIAVKCKKCSFTMFYKIINGYGYGRVQVPPLQKHRESQSGSAKKQLPAFLSQNNADILETIGRKIHIVIAPSNGVRCQ